MKKHAGSIFPGICSWIIQEDSHLPRISYNQERIKNFSQDLLMLTRLRGKENPEPIHRVFLTGANPFVLKTEKLLEIASLIHKYFPSARSIGCFARITDSVNKTDDELIQLRQAEIFNQFDKIISEVSE